MLAAIILAAGLSSRMGQPKMLLPWGQTTVLGQIIQVLDSADIDTIIVVTGGARQQIENAIVDLPAQAVFNAQYENDDMAISLTVGLEALPPHIEAALVALGDQPQIQEQVVQKIIKAYQMLKPDLVIPSYQMRRGHPWIVACPLWSQINNYQSPRTLRDFTNDHAEHIHYVIIENESILQDIDTPEDYQKERPSSERQNHNPS